MKIKILHLSDLHFQGNNSEQEIVNSSLSKKIEELVKNNGFYNLLILTGDIAYSGKKEEYEIAKIFINQIIQSTGISKNDVFIVPGNHDVDRSKIKEEHINWWYNFEEEKEITKNLSSDHCLPILKEKSYAYSEFVKEFINNNTVFGKYGEYVVNIESNSKFKLKILGINSTLFCGYDKDDKQKLALGLYQANYCNLKVNKDEEIIISCMHHPLDCFHKCDQTSFNVIQRISDIILFGHLHETSYSFREEGNLDKTLFISAGACYEKRLNENAFNEIEIDLDNLSVEVTFYKYLAKDHLWTINKDINIATNGVLKFNIVKNNSQKGKTDKNATPQQASNETYKDKVVDNYLDNQLEFLKESINKIGRLIAELDINKVFAEAENDKTNKQRYEIEIQKNQKLFSDYSKEYQQLKYVKGNKGLIINREEIIAAIDFYATIKINLKTYSKVPYEDSNFIGREKHIKLIWERLVKKEKVGITGIGGMGGVGKTAITMQICNLIKETWRENGEFPEYLKDCLPNKKYFADGILWIRFEKDEPLSVLIEEKIEGQIACSNFAKLEIVNRLNCLSKVLQYYDILIVLDSAEQNDSNYKIIKKHFNNFPILITSRKDLSDISTIDIPKMEEDEAIKLFKRFYLQDNWRNDLTKEELKCLKILIGKDGLGYLPLAIKILAARAKKYKKQPISEIKEDYVKKKLEILKERDLSVDEEKNKEAIFCFELSYDDLPDLYKEVFMRCGILRFPFSKIRISRNECFKDKDIDDAFDELINIRLIERENEEYTLHPLLREFALYKAQNAGLIDLYYDGQIKVFLDTNVEDFQANDYSQIQDLLYYCKINSNNKTIISFADKLNNQLYKIGLWERKIYIDEQAIHSAKQENNEEALGKYLFEKGDTYARQNNNEESNQILEEAKIHCAKNDTYFIDYLILTNKYYLGDFFHCYEGNFLYSRLASLLESEKKYKSTVIFLRTQGWIYSKFNHPNARNILLTNFKQENILGEQAHNYLESFGDLIKVFYSQNSIEKLILFEELRLKLSEKINSFETITDALQNLIDFSLRAKNIDNSNYYLKKYIEHTKEIGFYDRVKIISRFQAIIAILSNNFDEALHFIEKADETSQHKWKGKLYLAINNIEFSENELLKAQKFFIHKFELIELARTYVTYSLVELRKKSFNLQKSIEYFTRAKNTLNWFNINEIEEEVQIKSLILEIVDEHTFNALSNIYKQKYVLYKKDENNVFQESEPSYPSFFIKTLPNKIKDKKGKEMILIPEGTCFIGKENIVQYDVDFILENMEDFWKRKYKEVPQATELYLYPYYIDKEPVTNREYAEFCDANNHSKPSHWANNFNLEANFNNPVTNISIDDAHKYIKWYNNYLPLGCGKDLPTEPEWEKAIREVNYSFYGFEREQEVGKDNPNYMMILSATTINAENYEHFLKFIFGNKLYEHIKITKTYSEIDVYVGLADFKSKDSHSYIIEQLTNLSENIKNQYNWTQLLRLIVYSLTIKGQYKKRKVIEKLSTLNVEQIEKLFRILLNEFLEFYFNIHSDGHLFKQYMVERQAWINYLRVTFKVESDLTVSKTLLREFANPNLIKECLEVTQENDSLTEKTFEGYHNDDTGFRCVYPIFKNEDLINFLNY